MKELIQRVLNKAADVLRDKGWLDAAMNELIAQDLVGNGDNWQAQDRYREACSTAQQAVSQLIGERMGAHDVSIPHWNDHVCKDADEAIEVLKLSVDRVS
jgi:hypothetical protein